jgi:hypothetical protein
MPTLPLPDDFGTNGVCLDGGDLPVNSVTDVASEWAKEIQLIPVAPVRDAIEAGQTALLLEYQRRASYAAAQSDPARATDEYLDEILEEYGCPRKSGQTDDQARAVMFSTPPVVSPTAILTVANGVLSQYTAVSCRYAEHSDGWFVTNGFISGGWSSHVFATADNGTSTCTPNYPDRPQTPNRRPPGAMPNQNTYGRWFLLRVPDISSLDDNIASSFGGDLFLGGVYHGPSSQNEPAPSVGAPGIPETSASVGGFFVGSGSSATNTTYVFGFASDTVDGIYNSMISAINNAVGAGIRWDLVVDPQLVV